MNQSYSDWLDVVNTLLFATTGDEVYDLEDEFDFYSAYEDGLSPQELVEDYNVYAWDDHEEDGGDLDIDEY